MSSYFFVFPNTSFLACVKEIKSLIHEFDFDNCDLHNPENWGIDGNKYILLDYGVNEHIASLYN